MEKNIITNGVLSFALAGSLVAGTLTACTSNVSSKEAGTSETTEQIDPLDTVNDLAQNSNEVEAAIQIMVDEGIALAGYAEDAKQTDAYQSAKANAVDNFETVADFTFNGGEIAGYTAKEVGENTLETAEDAVYQLNATIEHFVPEYKERAKATLEKCGAWVSEKLTAGYEWLQSDETIDKMAVAYNKYQSTKEDFVELKDKVLSRAREKSSE